MTDGIAMGHAGMKSSLASRDVIANSVELTMRGHSLRRAGRHGRLRQEPARHDDGDDPPQRAVDLHLWRLDPAGPLPGPRRRRPGSVRGRRPPLRRQDGRRDARRAGARRVPVRRLVRRPVHRQHHGHGRRGDRPRAALQLRRAGPLRNPRRLLRRRRRAGDGTAQGRSSVRARS